ncbi:MAG: ribonucleoside triphosphate reductase, partial [Fusobacteria bacterium]|nr:ribonucleoside triphosphate reductase [Fusobacteriota bacterium]
MQNILVIKRDSKKVHFDTVKITHAIEKAFNATSTNYTGDILSLLTLRVTSKMQEFMDGNVIQIEKIQDCVEQVLESTGYFEVAKAYILYRKNRENVRNIESNVLDFKNVVDSYLESQDWRVKENATVTYSIGGLILHNSGAITANYWLSQVYDEEIAKAHKNADFHIHDLSMLAGYCAGWSLRQLIEEGLGGVKGKITSAPAKHLSTLVNQMVNFLGVMQNEWAGAQAFSSFDTYLAPFVKADNLSAHEVKQCVQSFVYGVNTPSRWGTQAPFSNITLDFVVPDDMKDKEAIIGGKPSGIYYFACQTEMDMINKAFIEIMLEGDANGRGFQYPIPTYNITKDFNWDSENAKILFEMAAKYGIPYFQNFVNSDLSPSDVRSMCCRLQLDKRELKRRGGGLFGADEFTGSVGVVTINLPRIAYMSENEEIFFEKLDHLLNVAKRSLETKRKVIESLNEAGLFPYTKRYLKHFNNHFATIGLVGMNEVTLNACWIGRDLTTTVAQNFSVKVLERMRQKMSDFQEETGHLYNLEATPAESTSYRLASKDKERFPDIKTAGENAPYYTNSSHLPVEFTKDIFEALDIQENLQKKYTGGTVFHTFLGERLEDWQTARELVKKIAYNYQIPYYTLSPTYSICKDHGYILGEVYNCPVCNRETEVYSRITGYY